jgi:hypothetical protein
MLTKLFAGSFVVLSLALIGSAGGDTFPDCCKTGEACCLEGAPCCESAPLCCLEGGDCCEAGADCCN